MSVPGSADVQVDSWLSETEDRSLANDVLDADFLPDSFEHVAFFDRQHEWVEMRLRATRPCSVYMGDLDLRVEFAAGEELRTEISAKFTPRRVEADLEAAGLVLDRWFTDDEALFGLALTRRLGPG
jgi:L-histidine N-alpha-methyltransferase